MAEQDRIHAQYFERIHDGEDGNSGSPGIDKCVIQDRDLDLWLAKRQGFVLHLLRNRWRE